VILLAGHLATARYLLEHYGYLALFLSLVIEYLVFFIPGETFLLVAAAYSATGRLNVVIVILAAAAGAAVGSNNAYWIGRHGGRPFLLAYSRRFRVGPRALDKLESFFERHGASAVFWLRFITVLRILVGYLAGVQALRFRTFAFFSVLGAVAWATVIALLGYAFAHNLGTLRHLLSDLGLIAIGTIVVIGLIAWRVWERRDVPKPEGVLEAN
jgi:membrane protein DedA with SNARE-associated domain